MEIYSTEEQQAEAIKGFFKEHGVSIALGIVIGLGGLYGWKAYNQHQITSAEAASDAFNQVAQSTEVEGADVIAQSETLMQQHEGSSYAVLAAFVAAKEAVDAQQLDVAAEKLTWAQQHAPTKELKAIATTRLARVQLAQQNYDAALATLGTELPASYEAAVAELKGDIYLAQGDKEQARIAYQSAADKGGLESNPLLQVKLDDLAAQTPAA
ncbi:MULTISPECIES: YfgM family protein [unclassified Pseudoalteromonas]|uniref:YfgM family protein n=1 Tax=unclassified Pseudoalteromonas TaxID=194690 RepID=UPI000CF6AD3B|nr:MULTISPECIES: tetratricopeptide repeat protein [unclassified Pseudoalteromonas]